MRSAVIGAALAVAWSAGCTRILGIDKTYVARPDDGGTSTGARPHPGGGSNGGTQGGSGGGGAGPTDAAGSSGADAATAGTAGAGIGGSAGVSAGGASPGGASGAGGIPPAGGASPGGAGPGGAGGSGVSIGPDCSTFTVGPAMVEVPVGPSAHFCIDATEVTNAQYQAFLSAGVPVFVIGACSGNLTLAPNDTGWPRPASAASNPVGGVDWCDAVAYCKWAGKHLCGAVGGGSNPPSSGLDSDKDEWWTACSAHGAHKFPYGSDTAQAGRCQDGAAPGDVGSKPTCVGGYPGIFDMSGNVAEWVDSCDSNGFQCRVRGGSFVSAGDNLSCVASVSTPVITFVADSGLNIGFRCCAG